MRRRNERMKRENKIPWSRDLQARFFREIYQGKNKSISEIYKR